jgi:hypothetical protein
MRKFLADMLPVIAGVLLALWAQGWADGRRDESRIRDALQALDREYQADLAVLDSALPGQRRMLLTFEATYDRVATTPMDVVIGGHGFETPDMGATDWQAVVGEANLPKLPLITLTLLSQISQGRRKLAGWEQQVLVAMMRPEAVRRDLSPGSRRAEKVSLRNVFHNYVQMEEALRARYLAFHRLMAGQPTVPSL